MKGSLWWHSAHGPGGGADAWSKSGFTGPGDLSAQDLNLVHARRYHLGQWGWVECTTVLSTEGIAHIHDDGHGHVLPAVSDQSLAQQGSAGLSMGGRGLGHSG